MCSIRFPRMLRTLAGVRRPPGLPHVDRGHMSSCIGATFLTEEDERIVSRCGVMVI